MKISRKTLGIIAFFSVSACLLLPSIGRSQVGNPRLKSPTINQAVKPVHAIPTEMDKVNMRIDELESKLAEQQKLIDSQQQTIAAQQKTLEIVTARPKGYTKAFITLNNFNNLPGTDAISYWARN